MRQAATILPKGSRGVAPSEEVAMASSSSGSKKGSLQGFMPDRLPVITIATRMNASSPLALLCSGAPEILGQEAFDLRIELHLVAEMPYASGFIHE